MSKLNQKQLSALMDNQQEIFNYLMKEKEKLMKLAQFEQRTVANIKKHFDASLKWWLKFQANHESLLPHKALWPDVYHHAVKESRMAMVEIKEFVAKFASTVLEGVEGLENLEEPDGDKQLDKPTPETKQPEFVAGGSQDDARRNQGNDNKTGDLLGFATSTSAPSTTVTTVTNSIFSPLFSPKFSTSAPSTTVTTVTNSVFSPLFSPKFGAADNNMKTANSGDNTNQPMVNQPLAPRTWEPFGGDGVRQPTGQGATYYHFDPEIGFVPVMGPPPSNGSSSNKMEEILEMLARNQVNQATTKTDNEGGCFRTETVVPTFDGNIKQFQAFKETFEKAVRKINSRVERFIVLRSKLKGRAATAIENLTLTEKNYENAWMMLDTWFGNERNLKTTTVMGLMNAQQTIHGDAESLLNFIQLLQSTLNNMADLGCDIENDFAVVMCLSKLDPLTMARFEDLYGFTTKLPTTTMLREFLEREYTVCNTRTLVNNEERKKKRPIAAVTRSHATTDDVEMPKKKTVKCYICKEGHYTKECPIFLNSSDRDTLLRTYKLCIYCVRHRFDYKRPCQLRLTLKCGICSGQHITEMHPQEKVSHTNVCISEAQVDAKTPENTTMDTEDNSLTLWLKNEAEGVSEVFLPRCRLNVEAADGTVINTSATLDGCSQSCYVTEDFVQKAGYKKKKVNVKILGVAGAASKAQSIVTIKIKTRNGENAEIKFKALVVPRVTGKLPAFPCEVDLHDFNKPLADPDFTKPTYTPILLGANVLAEIMREGVEKRNGLLLQNTIFGWVVSGQAGRNDRNTDNEITVHQVTSSHVALTELETQLIKFWDLPIAKEEMEELDEHYCETLYTDNVTRTDDGRYVVPTLWKTDAEPLGDSYTQALRFYLGQERRWAQDEEHKRLSDAFMQEYLDLGHMSPVPKEKQQDKSGNVYYIRYFSVVRKDALTTKLRNVFDASAKSSNGVSLNQIIHPGPKLQTHIPDLITAVRQFQFIYSSDVSKMYRQFLVQDQDRDFMRVLWRPTVAHPICEYRMNTVTYGVDCAPFQAIRTLHQIADDNAPDDETKRIIKEAFYMDDLLFGGDSVGECQEQIQKIISTLDAGKLPLTKWSSNEPAVLQNIDENKKITAYTSQEVTTTKTLGLLYNPKDDEFSINIAVPTEITFTKRKLLSIAASIFDPLGWLLPVVMQLRILLQMLWLLKYDWDDEIDEKIKRKFENCLTGLAALKDIRIPRWTGNVRGSKLQLIGFCDASNDGYAAVVYSRVEGDQSFIIRLLAARGHVTPMKSKINSENKLNTIPKMELEGIVLLVELFQTMVKRFTELSLSFIAYTDSEVALAWVRNQKEQENKFVKRRVNKIRKFLKPADLNYVKSAENPADPASRGLSPEKLAASELWRNGPAWLQDKVLPITPFNDITPTTSMVAQTKIEDEESFIERFSCIRRLQRAVAIALRWRVKTTPAETKSSDKPRRVRPVTAEEILNARKRIIKFQQQRTFAVEIERMTKDQGLPARHWLTPLAPEFDKSDELIRVGGRLAKAKIPEAQKHPIVLGKCHLLDLIIRETHLENGHCGNSLVERFIRNEFWCPALKQRIKKILRQCKVCIRWKGQTTQPQMADLPQERVEISPPFAKTGVDLCGPFHIKASAVRFDKIIKVWVAAFVCLVTKAVHLEICSDLSTDNFLAAYTRFSSRRGSVSLMLSDNGSNFRGASKRFSDGWNEIAEEAKERLALQQVDWKFIPVHSPNFGGLWESAVRSLKFLMKRMSSIENLTFEEFQTLLCRIEGVLNSRPLYPNPSDPNDELALTPFHFLAQRSFKGSPADFSLPDKTPITKRWLLVLQIMRQVWEKFQAEYLNQLQKRYKWKYPTRNLEVGDIVLVQEPNLKPSDWKMARITKCYPDEKGTVRRVDVKTSQKEAVHKAVNKLVPLMPEDNEPEPALRRSTRIKEANRTTNLLTKAVMCWLTLVTPINGLLIQSLVPGLHLHRLGNASIKAFDLDFAITTTINLTHDIDLIELHLKEFRDFCEQHENGNFTKLHQHCVSTEKAVEEEAGSIILGLRSSYSHRREKRSLGGITTKALLKVAGKHWPEMLLTAGMAYQQYENAVLETHVEDLKRKISKVSGLMLNLTDIEYEVVDKELNNLINQQHAILLEEQINDYSANIQALVAEVQARHQNIIQIRPIEELRNFLDKLEDNLKFFDLPDLNPISDIFTIHPATKYIQDEMAVVEFKIPLVQKKKFIEFGLISIPTSEHQAVILPNGEIVQRLAVSRDNMSWFDIGSAEKSLRGMYENVRPTLFNPCLREIFKTNPTAAVTSSCPVLSKVIKEDQFYSLGEDLAVVLKANDSDIKILCDDTTENIFSSASLVQFPNCVITNGAINITTHKEGNVMLKAEFEPLIGDLAPPEIVLAEKISDPRVAKIRDELVKELAHPENWLTSKWKIAGDSIIMGLSGVGLGAAISLSGFFLFQWLKKRKSRNLRNIDLESGLEAKDENIDLHHLAKVRWAKEMRRKHMNKDLAVYY